MQRLKAASEKSGANLTGEAQEQVVGGLEALLDPIVEKLIRSETGEKLVQTPAWCGFQSLRRCRS